MISRLAFLLSGVLLAILTVVPVRADVPLSAEMKQELRIHKAAVKANPKSAQARFDLAMTHAYTGRVLSGWDELRKIPDLDPAFPTRAVQHYEEWVQKEPLNWRLHFKLAFAYYFTDQKDKSQTEFEKILLNDPKHIWAMGYLALIKGEQGAVEESISLCRKALAIEPRAAAIHYLLSEALARKGDGAGAFAEKVEALRLTLF